MEIIIVIFLILFFPLSQEHFYWLILVGVTVWAPQSGVNDGFSVTFPYAPDEDVTSRL